MRAAGKPVTGDLAGSASGARIVTTARIIDFIVMMTHIIATAAVPGDILGSD